MDIFNLVTLCAVVYLEIINWSTLVTAVSDSDSVLKRLVTLHHCNKVLLDSVQQPYSVVYPKQIRNDKLVGISTREDANRHSASKMHYTRATFVVRTGDKTLELNLLLNQVILSAGITIKHFISLNQRLLTSGVENCYYQGQVKGDQWSTVAVSTCHGIRGVIQLQNETYIIQPLIGGDQQKHHPHIIYKESTPEKAHCGNKRGLWLPYSKLHKGEYMRRLKFLKIKKMERDGPEPTKRLHLALVFDSTFQRQLNLSHSHMITYTIQAANLLHMYYKSLHTDIVLVYTEIWDSVQQFTVSPVTRRTLHQFLQYKLRTMTDVSHMAAQFVTTQHFEDDSFGMSIPDSICTARAVGVCTTPNVFEPQKLTFSLAHMIAHNLGINHDEDTKSRIDYYEGDCDCATSDVACIMANRVLKSADKNGRMFSTCSQADLEVAVKSGLASCLLAHSQATFSQACGNNHVERGEECDCGSKEECESHDSCCDPQLCLLKSWATCHHGPCCHNCTLRPPDHLCRPKMTECDVPEYCDGRNGQCPHNDYIHDGYPCYNRTGYCSAGICPTLDQQCRSIWGMNASRSNRGCYERFNPTGSFSGHCGLDPGSGHFIKCENQDVMCGLLHCDGGNNKPLFGTDKSFSKTAMSFGNLHYDCKSVLGATAVDMPNLGVVQDGTQCDDSSVCVERHCVPLVARDLRKCRAKPSAVVCSGRGICTNSRRCFCDPGWGGRFCTVKVTTLPHTTRATPTTPRRTTLNVSVFIHRHGDSGRVSRPYSTAPAPTKKKTLAQLSTTWLVIILVAVVLCLVLMFALFMICCRRRSKPLKTSGSKCSVYSNLSLSPKKASVSIVKKLPSAKKSIKLLKFGALPPYKPSGGNMKKKKKGLSSGDESDLGELPRPPIIVVSPNSAKPPERGILKNAMVAPERYAMRGGIHDETYANLDSYLPSSALLAPRMIGDYEGDVDAQLQRIIDCDEGCSCSDGEFFDDDDQRGVAENLTGVPYSQSFDFALPEPPKLGSPGCRESVCDREYSNISHAKLAGGIVDYSLTPDSAARSPVCNGYNVERGREMISSPKTEVAFAGTGAPNAGSPKSNRSDYDLSPSPEQRLVSYEQELASPNSGNSSKRSPLTDSHPVSTNSDIARTFRAIYNPADLDAWKLSPRLALDDDCPAESASSYSCEKSSGYGSEADAPLSFYRPRFNPTEKCEPPPKYSSVIRTGPNRIELIPADLASPRSADSPQGPHAPPRPDVATKPKAALTREAVPCIDRSLEEIPHSSSTSSELDRVSIDGSNKSSRPISLNVVSHLDAGRDDSCDYRAQEINL